MTEVEMVGWYHGLNEYEFEQALGVGDDQESLVCCSPWGCKESVSVDGRLVCFLVCFHLTCLFFAFLTCANFGIIPKNPLPRAMSKIIFLVSPPTPTGFTSSGYI